MLVKVLRDVKAHCFSPLVPSGYAASSLRNPSRKLVQVTTTCLVENFACVVVGYGVFIAAPLLRSPAAGWAGLVPWAALARARFRRACAFDRWLGWRSAFWRCDLGHRGGLLYCNPFLAASI